MPVEGKNDHGKPSADRAAGRVVIIGGGIAGLSCGCYLQMNGIPTEILEAGKLPGGLCTAWHRGPYVFDGCLRWLMGVRPPSVFHQVWTELDAISGRAVLVSDELLRIEDADGRVFVVPAGLDDLARALKRLAPEDSDLIDRLIQDARRCTMLEPPLEKPLELMNLFEKTKMGLRYLPLLPVVMRWKNIPLADYLARYRNKFLRAVLFELAGNAEMSALVLVMLLAFRSRENTGFVAGGSWDFAMAIANRYTRLGGSIRYKARVDSVIVENDRATGVRCVDGTVVPAATVVSCADGHTTIFKMLGGQFVDKKILNRYQQARTFPAIIQVSLGIRKQFQNIPHSLNMLLHRPLRVDDQTQYDRIEVGTFGPESGLCPAGTMVMTVRLPTRCEFWTQLKKNHPLDYRSEKRRILQEIVAILDQRFSGLAEHLEHADFATPATFIRYTGNWQGSYEGWLPTPGILRRPISFRLPRLKNFYMAGHWVMAGGGLPSVALAGRYAAQMICAQNGKKFITTPAQV